jgi:hypothetical protein
MTMMTTTTMRMTTGTTRKGEAMTIDTLLVERLRDIRMSGATLRRVAANRIEALRADRDRLREALEQLACKCSSNCAWLHDDICPSWIARAALTGKEPSHE